MSNDINPISEADYEAIEEAVLETSRGRWFLAEYARRNRNADTSVLLDAIQKLERTVEAQPAAGVAASIDQIRFDIVEMAAAIAQTKREIAAIKPEGEDQGHAAVAADELGAIVQSTEKATQDILGSTEKIQELAWSIREEGMRDALCDELDKLVTEIYTASSFQDLTGQRISKVVSVLGYLEERLEAMRQIWGDDDTTELHAAETESAASDTHLLNGPQSAGNGLDQYDIDLMIAEDEDTSEPEPEADAISSTGPNLVVETDPDEDEEIVFTEDDVDDDGALALEAAEEIVTFSGDDDGFAIEVSDADTLNGHTAAPDHSGMDDEILPESFDDEADAPEMRADKTDEPVEADDPEEDDHIIMVRKPISNGSADASLWREAVDPPAERRASADDEAPRSADDLSEKDTAALFS